MRIDAEAGVRAAVRLAEDFSTALTRVREMREGWMAETPPTEPAHRTSSVVRQRSP